MLIDRARMLKSIRAFFEERGVMEVDVPILSAKGSVDPYIDLVEARALTKRCFLHSSPEYGMKRLLAEGVGDIYQLSHVFRDEEYGEKHNPEFTMAEWYRIGWAPHQMIGETIDFIRLFLEEIPTEYEEMTYVESFQRYASSFPEKPEDQDLLFSCEIEPRLGQGKVTVLYGFPKERAALSQIGENGLAKRFELFFDGTELGNGYQELCDAHEQQKRLVEANQIRKILGKTEYPIDDAFLRALKQGIPDCCGIAVGFDRLMMLRHKSSHINEVISFNWENS